MMIPSPIMDGSAPHITVTVQSSEFSVILDSGAEMSVLPLSLVAKFQPPVQLPPTVHEVRTFGLSTATLFGPVPLDISLCGVEICHSFYFVDATLPPIVGYDLMKAARLVVDVDNHLVWSRLLKASFPSSPNPPVSVSNPTVNACVSFVRPEPSAPSAEESSPSPCVVEAPPPVSIPSSVESPLRCPVWLVARCPSSSPSSLLCIHSQPQHVSLSPTCDFSPLGCTPPACGFVYTTSLPPGLPSGRPRRHLG